ncbi:phagocyte signaling-impaired protein [Diabrotica virgifera virgifera]|uniref:N-terminal acetyltransferase B complex subunit MDM20 homolog n=1 Tax=Diabrotica virgifera virgifera TaxID=50390 RepID=A0ABM5IQB7_DIAVI|nr:phagocyte signaling-impaired protein [Diabrotica virgifera virgifera]
MSRSQANSHVQQDNSVVERRLRPIYDWLDSGNNKKALQECDKVLKKTPSLQCAKALKALTLRRIGKDTECNAILDMLTKEIPSDDATLQAMALCYREMQELEKICKLYEIVVKSNPNNEELHTQLFMSYVRIGDFKAQQQTAMALYKSKPKNPYYCWAIMSVILQATRGEGSEDPQKRKLLLSLAERMFTKLISDNKVDAEQEVQLYVMILNLLGKYEEIIDILNGPLGVRMQCANIPQVKLEYLKKLNRWIEVNLICKGILIYSVDRWDIWKEYIKSVFELMVINQSAPSTPEKIGEEIEVPDDTAEKAHEFICGIIESGTGNEYLLRGPYLARFELCLKLNERNMKYDILGDLMELFIEYFRKFGHKQCCVSDLRIYLNLLDSEKKTELASRLIKDVGISSTSVPQTERQMQRHISALQLSRLCGGHRNLQPDHLRALITALSLHYQHGFQTYGENLLPTDLGPSDPYALMAAHVLYDLAHIEKSSNCIQVALRLLECLLNYSPSNFHAKLLAIRLYHELGGSISAHDMYCSLDVKHLQLDSLGFIHCARLPTTGLFTLCTNLFDATLKFFSSNYKDSSDHLTFSYKFGSFMKIDEFMDFRERLNNSLHYSTVVVDRIILNLVECMSLETLYSLAITPQDCNINWKSLIDNHDLSAYTTWDPERINGQPEDWQQTKDLFEQDIWFLKLRSSVLLGIAHGIEIVKSIDGTRSECIKALRKLLDEWKSIYEEILDKKIAPIQQGLLPLPLPSRLHGALEVPYFTVFSSFFEFLISLTSDDNESVEKCTSCVVDELTKLTEVLKNHTLKKPHDFLDKRKSLEIAVNCVEIISISSVICVLCGDLIKPLQIKKGRKKSAEPKSKEYIQKISEKLKTEMNSFCDIIQDWSETYPEESVDVKFENLNLNGNDNITEKIRYSYTIANKEMQLILKTKVKLLT